MSGTAIRFETTPNPNALKCPLEPDADRLPRSYFNADQARDAGDRLAIDLFGVPGVSNVLIHTGFVTVGKAPGASWGPIKWGVGRVLTAAGVRAP